MPIIKLEKLKEEYVTPKHSTAYGRLITGEQVEVGILNYKKGEGAKEHTHPHEQIIIVLEGKMRVTLDDEVSEIGPGYACHMPPNVPHSIEVLEDLQIISCKGVIDGAAHKI